MKARQGDWFQTYTGKRFYILDPRPEDIDIRDIAHSLAMKCRYGGHVSYFYSVAEHSVLLSHLVPSPLAFMALMHDAEETYTGDIMRPIKESIGDGWRSIEARLNTVISEVFGLSDDADKWAMVKEYDSRILTDERDVLQQPVLPGKNYGDKLGVTINCLPWQEAERVFLDRFEVLAGRVASPALPELTADEVKDVQRIASKLAPEKV